MSAENYKSMLFLKGNGSCIIIFLIINITRVIVQLTYELVSKHLNYLNTKRNY